MDLMATITTTGGTLRIARLDESGQPIDISGPLEVLGQIKMITLDEEPPIEESPWTTSTRRWSFTWKVPRYSRASRKAFQQITGVTYVERQRARRKGKQ